MPDIKKTEKRWIENFKRSPLVDPFTGNFNSSYAHQLYYGMEGDLYPEDYPQGFINHYHTFSTVEKNDSLHTIHIFLSFIGIDIQKELLFDHALATDENFEKLHSGCNNILKMLAHYDTKLSINNPYKDNLKEFNYLLRIECSDRTQLNIFDEPLELPYLYNKFTDFPEGYEKNEIVAGLFKKIENSNSSYFITGKAGTGKSTFIQYFAAKTRKKLLMCAFTGIAAINIKGQTIHSLFRFPPQALMPGDDEIKKYDRNAEQYKLIKQTQVIVIDEVSMLRSDIVEAIDCSLRYNGGEPGMPFGGKQIIFVGDIFQLPPVTDEADEIDKHMFTEVYKSKYFFDAPAYRRLNPYYFEFKKSYRQGEDLDFLKILDSIRICEHDEDVLAKLNERYYPNYIPRNDEFVITLASSNNIAYTENMRRLGELDYTTFKFEAEITGDYSKGKQPADKLLELKKHAQIIFIKNDLAKRWVNGTIAKIEFISDNIIEIRLQNGNVHKLEKITWENRSYKFNNGKIVSELKGTFTQYPIKLAWAITVHKSQGLTFEKLAIDLGKGAFINGQLYTALSRCRSLKGIALKKQITPQDIIIDQRIIDFHETEQILNGVSFDEPVQGI